MEKIIILYYLLGPTIVNNKITKMFVSNFQNVKQTNNDVLVLEKVLFQKVIVSQIDRSKMFVSILII